MIYIRNLSPDEVRVSSGLTLHQDEANIFHNSVSVILGVTDSDRQDSLFEKTLPSYAGRTEQEVKAELIRLLEICQEEGWIYYIDSSKRTFRLDLTRRPDNVVKS